MSEEQQEVVPVAWQYLDGQKGWTDCTWNEKCGAMSAGIETRMNPEYQRWLRCETVPQPAPAPREISEQECEEFVRQAWKRANQTHRGTLFSQWDDDQVNKLELAIARYALESRAPQTAPRDPYKRGQLLP